LARIYYQLTSVKTHALISEKIVKNQDSPLFVIPAKAGSQCFRDLWEAWTPAFAGVTISNKLNRLFENVTGLGRFQISMGLTV